MASQPPVPQYLGTTEAPRNGRIRVNRACLRCRSHKIKCTGTFPCANCIKNNEECRFGNDEPPVKIRRTRSPEATADSYTEYLENRVRYLESLLARLMAERLQVELELMPLAHQCMVSVRDRLNKNCAENDGPDTKVTHTDGCANNEAPKEPPYHDPQNPYELTFPQTEVRPPMREGAAAREFRAASEAMRAADNNGEPAGAETFRATVTLAKWRMVDRPQLTLVTELCNSVYSGLSDAAKAHVDVPRRQFFGWNMSGCHYLQPEQFPPPPDMRALPAAQCEAWVDHFFREINPLFAIVHETVFREQIRASAADDTAATNFTVLFRAMLCLVYALSIRFTQFVLPQGPARNMLELEDTLFQYAHRVVLIILFEWERFELIQCWLLITLYLRIAHRQTSAFTALGRAVHMTRVMGLGRAPLLAPVPQYEMLKSRRIFESVYCFDRVVGYLGGRRRSFPVADISRRLPLFDFAAESTRDDWITLPAFALIHIARVANLIPLDHRDEPCTRMLDRELRLLDEWLTQNGFGLADDIFPENPAASDILPTVRAQVRFHYYDLVLTVHGQVLFSILGRPLPTAGMRLDSVRHANAEIVRLAQRLARHGQLYVPWYTTLHLVFNAGICMLVLLQASVAVHEARAVLAGAMAVLQQLQDLPVYEDGKMVFFERFKMVRECMWALKTANHIVSLGFTEAAQGLRDLGIDHGNADVNRQYFSQFGLIDAPAESLLDKLALDQSRRGFRDRQKMAALISALALETYSQPNLRDGGGGEIMESLRWFDNWLDFGDGS